MDRKPINSPNRQPRIKNPYLITILFKKNDNLVIQFIKYVTLGNIANVADFSTLYLLTEFAKFHYLISAAISFVVGVITGHIINVLWIFQKSRLNTKKVLMIIFLISIVGLIINEVIIYLLVKYFSTHYMLSKAISATIVMFWNFYGRRKWVFNK